MRLRAAILTAVSLLAAGAFATPASAAEPTIDDLMPQVGNDQTLSVCNSSDDALMGLNCTSVPVSAVGAVPASQFVHGNTVLAACPKGQDGLIIPQATCTPLTVP